MKSDFHLPIMLNEVLNGLDIKSNGIYVDATLGRAGHSSEILKKLTTGKLIGIDQDKEAIEYSIKKLSSIGSNFEILKGNFENIKELLNKNDIQSVDGILFDLGVSSPQFDEDYRGFSYRFDAPLDMRMDSENSLTAEYIVNHYSLNELTRVFKEYGEEKYAYAIAKKIVEARDQKEIKTTFELVELIKEAKPKKELLKKGHPAKQVFQALRIEVNDELNVLKKGLEDAINLLNVDGRIVVITFHSLEDRIVKQLFKKYAVIEGDRVNTFIKSDELKSPEFEEVNKKVIVASEEELKINHRAASAKLRILKRIKR